MGISLQEIIAFQYFAQVENAGVRIRFPFVLANFLLLCEFEYTKSGVDERMISVDEIQKIVEFIIPEISSVSLCELKTKHLSIPSCWQVVLKLEDKYKWFQPTSVLVPHLVVKKRIDSDTQTLVKVGFISRNIEPTSRPLSLVNFCTDKILLIQKLILDLFHKLINNSVRSLAPLMKNPFVSSLVDQRPTNTTLPGSKVRAVLRIRPFLNSERESDMNCPLSINKNNNTCDIISPRNSSEVLSFSFDGCYDSDVSNASLFKLQILPLLSSLFSGINVTIFAYGNTGAGKTFTMEGTPSSPGLVPLALQNLFSLAGKAPDSIFKISFLEIYNEKVYDLLSGSGLDLQIREDQNKNIFISNLTTVRINSFEEFASHWEAARRHRRSALTSLNPNSSRSHSCLTLTIESGIQGAGWHSPRRRAHRLAKLHMIDLAGSEDNRRTQNVGIRMVESGSINKSLFVLSNVVDALNSNSSRIPYRDSKLTRLLQDSLGGRSNALIIANVSPNVSHVAETYHTLNFASKSREIINNPIINEIPKIEKAIRPSPLTVSYQPITSNGKLLKGISNYNDATNVFELHKRVCGSKIKLSPQYLNQSKGCMLPTSILENNDSPIKPCKKRKSRSLQVQYSGSKNELEKSKVTLLWTSLREEIRANRYCDKLLDDYILYLSNSGSTSLIKQLPGIGDKRATIILEARMNTDGPYTSIAELGKRCSLKTKLLNTIKQSLVVRALYGEASEKENEITTNATQFCE